jgi:hypothetical protein
MKCSKFKHNGCDTNDGTRRYKGLHQAIRCEVLDNSSDLRLPADFPILRWVAIGPHKLVASPAVLRHFCNQKDSQSRLEQLKLNKTDMSMGSETVDS